MNIQRTVMITCAAAVTLGCLAPIVAAQPIVRDPIKIDNGDPPTPKSKVRRPASLSTDHFTNRAEFLIAVANLGINNPPAEGFELLPPDNFPSAQSSIITPDILTTELVISGDDLETAASDALFGVFSVPFSGARPADGANYVRVTGVSRAELVFELSVPTRFFGISFSDWGDIAAGKLTQIIENSVPFVIDESPRPDASGPLTGDQIFFGVIESDPFTTVVIRSTASGDGFAIDEIFFRRAGRSTDLNQDPAAYLHAFIQSHPSADLTGDGVVDFFDLSHFLTSLDR